MFGFEFPAWLVTVAIWVLSIGSLALGVALLPALFRKSTYFPRLTSVHTAIWLTLYSPAFVILGQAYTAACMLFTASVWWAIVWKRGIPPAGA